MLFEVHRNSGKHKDTIPFVVVAQSAQFDSYHRRVVAPLVRATAIGKVNYAGFNPTFPVAVSGPTPVRRPTETIARRRTPAGLLASPQLDA